MYKINLYMPTKKYREYFPKLYSFYSGITILKNGEFYQDITNYNEIKDFCAINILDYAGEELDSFMFWLNKNHISFKAIPYIEREMLVEEAFLTEYACKEYNINNVMVNKQVELSLSPKQMKNLLKLISEENIKELLLGE